MVTEMNKPTRVATGPDFTPSPSDAQNLLAAIAKIEKKVRIQVAPQFLTPNDKRNEPYFSPTRQNWRLSKVLDSLANLCVFEPDHEVIATALRVDDNAGSVELIIASNTDVQDFTVTHLQEIWKTLQQISILCHERYPRGPLQDTPHRIPEDRDVEKLSAKLARLCLEFSFGRLQKRVNRKFDRFSAIKIDDSDLPHHFQIVRDHVNVLEKRFTRYEGAKIGKPHHSDEKNWERLWKRLRLTERAIDRFLCDGGFRPEDMAAAQNFLSYQSYLRKIGSLTDDIEVLAKLAHSPQCQQLFTFNFTVTALAGQLSQADSVPQAPGDWEDVFERALLFRNDQGLEEEDYVIDIEQMEKDTKYMAEEMIGPDLVIHCELRILLDIFETETEPKNHGIPKAYTYIGVSKLSCRGCHAFFQAFNKVHKTHFVTKGSHNKSYWPWQFPQSCPESDKVLSRTYGFIAQRWVTSYDGYTKQYAPLASDSVPQSVVSGSYIHDPSESESVVDMSAEED